MFDLQGYWNRDTNSHILSSKPVCEVALENLKSIESSNFVNSVSWQLDYMMQVAR